MAAVYSLVPETVLLSSNVLQAQAQVSEYVVLAAAGPPDSRWSFVSEAVILASSSQGNPVARVSEVAVLVAYVTGPREVFDSRAWTFTFDGHPFYVLTLGGEGTFVYDLSTKQWAQFSTQGYGIWNMEYGTNWNNGVVAGDNLLPTVWRLDPHSFLDDDFRPIERICTAGIPMSSRNTLRTGSLVLDATPQVLGANDTPTVTLSISDDDGETFTQLDTIVATGERTQEFAWRSLGLVKAPGRVFKIVDSGGFTKIDGADLETGS